jgi:hypothetical protein
MPEDIVVENNRKQQVVAEKEPGGSAVEGGKFRLLKLTKEIRGGKEQ